MNITLAEALPLKKQISKILQDKIRERNDNAFLEYEKDGEKVEEPAKSFKELTSELEEVRLDYRKMDFLMDQANINCKLDWEGNSLSIKEAIELSKQIRGEAIQLKSLSYSKPIEKVVSYRNEGPATYKKALFKPEELVDDALRLEKKANRLSMLIEKTNHLHEITFVEADKYL